MLISLLLYQFAQKHASNKEKIRKYNKFYILSLADNDKVGYNNIDNFRIIKF